MDRPDSFTRLERYMDEIRESNHDAATEDCKKKKQKKKTVVVVSNKTDLPNLT